MRAIACLLLLPVLPARSDDIAEKRAHFALVAQELAQRPTGHLTPAQRANRARAIAALEAYAKRGVFPRNDVDPRYRIPSMIDRRGTRCALAHVIEVTGRPGLLARLARDANHVFVPALVGDPGLRDWLVEQGLTLEEAAFIQLPPSIFPGDEGDFEEPEDTPPPTHDPGDAAPPDTGGPDTGGPDAPAPDTGRDDPRGGARTRRATAPGPTWRQWWDLNREAFLDLPARYRERTGATRPSEADLAIKLRPFLRAAEGPELVRGMALLAWARTAARKDEAAILDAARAYLKDRSHRYRDYMLLTLGLLRGPEAAEALREVALDTKAGRRMLDRGSAVPERMRAFAALALATSKDAPALPALLEDLRHATKKLPDYRVAALTAIGRLARDAAPEDRTRVREALLRELRRKRWPREALATIPTALARAGDAEAAPVLLKIVRRFRGPREVRQSAALALGHLADPLDGETVEALVAIARRDPDPVARRFAVLSLGEMCARAPRSGLDDEQAAAAARIAHLLDGAFRGFYKQASDTPYFCLAAALHARTFGQQAAAMRARIERVARDAGSPEHKAAAAAALALLGDRAAIPAVRRLFDGTRNATVRAYAAEALGVLGDAGARDELLALVREAPSPLLRYRAGLGLGFLADRDLVEPLVKALGESRSVTVRGTLARLIGELGDARALEGLMRIAGDPTKSDRARGRALAALGMLGQPGDLAWNAPLKRGFNYAAATPAVADVLRLG